MKKAKIKAISYYLPDQVLTNKSISQAHPEWSINQIENKTGIKERRVSGTELTVSDLAVFASEKLFTEYNIERSSIDFILLCTQSPDYLLPTTACLVQTRLGLKTGIGALDFNLGCSGYVYGLSLAKGLIESQIANNILLITSETYTKLIHSQDKSNKTIFGDAASATLITAESGISIGDFVFGTDGSGFENLIVKNGGSKNRDYNGIDILDKDGNFLSNDNYLFMNGPEIFRFTTSSVPTLVENVLNKNNLHKDDIDLFVFHQANKFMLDFIRKKILIPEDKFFYFLENCGNTVSSTIPIALKEAINTKLIISGSKILLAGFGVGYSWAGCTLENDCNG